MDLSQKGEKMGSEVMKFQIWLPILLLTSHDNARKKHLKTQSPLMKNGSKNSPPHKATGVLNSAMYIQKLTQWMAHCKHSIDSICNNDSNNV